MHIGLDQPEKNATLVLHSISLLQSQKQGTGRIASLKPGTRRGTFLQIIGSLKTVPVACSKPIHKMGNARGGE